tara:strand:+ start:3593 stop:4246 length:654 start_codon:yes stop_codon:yes gene_type:complete
MLWLKLLAKCFYTLKLEWIGPIKNDFSQIRLIIFLNHTSLYEPIYADAAPVSFLYQMAKKMVAPAADVTMNRPLVGLFFKLLGPKFVPITRKRDKTWFHFLKLIKERHIILILPEGRMMRGNGLDKHGKPMDVRSGVAEILEQMDDGRVMIAYSGGLHHVQHPGQFFPRVFKKIAMNIEIMEISAYKNQFEQTTGIPFRKAVVADLNHRLKTNCPKL